MARSAAYDQWEDVGMAFTEGEVASFDTQAWAEQQLRELCEQLRVLFRRSQIPKSSKPEWSNKAAKALRERVTWLCKAAELPTIDFEKLYDLPDPKSVEGKSLTEQAQRLDPEAWVGELVNRTEAQTAWLVTISRRAGRKQQWKKTQWSLSNRVVNAVAGNARTLRMLQTQLESLPKGKSVD